MFNLFKPFDMLTIKSSGIVAYNPLINYDWSTTTTSGLRYLKDVGSTPTYNASMYFGRGAYLNGVDQTITVPINTTIQTALKRVNGVVTINETSQTLTNYVISGLGVHKDYYLFTRLLTTAEKDSYTNTPELFYAMAQADNTCVLNMPMCETSSTVRNYKTGIDHPITNYTTSVRNNAKNLQYGLQTCKFVRDSLGVIQSASDYLECDGVGYGNTGLMIDASVLGKSFSFEIIDKVTRASYEGDGIYNVCGWQTAQFKWLGNTAANSISLGVFNHRVAIYNAENNTLQVFVNKVGGNIINCTVSTTASASYPIGGIFQGGSIYEPRSRLNPLRLFKVHNKALTQSEITANYNSYVAKGLLS